MTKVIPHTNLSRRRAIDDAVTFFDGQSIHDVFQKISTAKLKSICRKYIQVVRAKASRSELYTLVVEATVQIQESIRQTSLEPLQEGDQRYSRRTTSLANETANSSTGGESHQQGMAISESLVPTQDGEGQPRDSFMRVPPKEIVNRAIGEFIERTNNSALAHGVCAVCARETKGGELTVHRVDCIPNMHRLHPVMPHSQHTIINGMLLHPAGLKNDDSASMCTECCRALTSDKIPSFALANGMWIGEIPHELAFLTLPERLLIAKYFPAAYIIKLYPKKKGARHWDKCQLYSGLKGNVSTYQLDQAQIACMVDGSIMPQQAKVLTATIGITFVGPKNLPDRGLPDMFKVRRIRV